jgi:hypothetical protein
MQMTSQDTIATVTVQNISELEKQIRRAKHVNIDFSFERNRLGPTQEYKYVPMIIAKTGRKTVIYDGINEEDPDFGYCRIRTLSAGLNLADKLEGEVYITIDGVPYNKVRKVLKTHIEALHEKMQARKTKDSTPAAYNSLNT